MHEVLILTDYTPTCFWSVIYGLDFCNRYGYSPVILHAEIPGGIVNQLERDKVSSTVDLYNRRFNLGATVEVRTGSLGDVVGRETSSGHYKVIILCTHGKLGLQSVTGSVAIKIISSLHIPILVMQGKRFQPLTHAVVPLLCDDFNTQVLMKYVELAGRMGVSVDVVGREENMEMCLRLANQFKNSKITSIPRSTAGLSFVRQVVAYCEKENADLIMGLPPAISSQQYLDNLEQLLFNIHQIPVLCP